MSKYALSAQESSTAKVDQLKFNPQTYRAFGRYLGSVNLNIGCGRNIEPGFYNLDRVEGSNVDLVCNLEMVEFLGIPNLGDGKTRLPGGGVDCILASHVLEHISNLIPVMREFHRILRPGGHLIAITPHASSDDAWEDPTHVRAFTENSWMYWDRRLYERDGHHGSYPSPVDFIFETEQVTLVPQADVMEELARGGITDHEEGLRFGRRFLRNVVREVHAVLRKVEG